MDINQRQNKPLGYVLKFYERLRRLTFRVFRENENINVQYI